MTQELKLWHDANPISCYPPHEDISARIRACHLVIDHLRRSAYVEFVLVRPQRCREKYTICTHSCVPQSLPDP